MYSLLQYVAIYHVEISETVICIRNIKGQSSFPWTDSKLSNKAFIVIISNLEIAFAT